MKKQIFLVLLLIISGTAQTSYGLRIEQIGSNSARVIPPGIQPGLPKGIFEISDLESRVYSIDINGNENIYFKATIEEINEIVSLFSKVRMRDHIVRIRAGKGKTKTFKGIEIEYNLSLHVVRGIVLLTVREEQREDLPLEPCLTILTGDDSTILDQLKWPENIIIENEIPDVSIKSKKQQPQRNYFFGLLEFADGSPPVEFDRGVNSRITLWEQDKEDGINIGDINNKGYFTILLSNEELTNLKKGKMWLTVTISNYLTEAKKTDQKFPVEMLTQDKEKAQPVKVKGPEYYYGRILFEDGSPAVLDKSLWKGREITISFPFAGLAHIDSQGYFKVYFTDEQYEKVKARKVRNNTYIPDSQDTSRARAIYAFPVAELSKDKSKAGVFKISRPTPPKQELIKAESKIGKSMPGFGNIRFEGFQEDKIRNKALLVCFWDMDQRPCRQCIRDLEKQAQTLQDKNIVVLAVHSGTKDENQLRQWLKKNAPSLMAGIIQGDPYDTLLAWGAKASPWLIVTDEQHVISSEGSSLNDLELVN